MYYLIKIAITTILIVLISEISKKSSFVGALLASIPLISVMAMIWLYAETKDVQKVSDLATGVFWLVIPSLVLFISLPILLKYQVNFYLSLFLSIALTIFAYWIMVFVLNLFGIKL
jgi:hypothetical protein